MGNTLKDASTSKKDSTLSRLYEALEYGEKLIQAENNEVDEMADTRGRRQKSVLLEKVERKLRLRTIHYVLCVYFIEIGRRS